MPHYGQITGSDDAGRDGTWLVALDDDGTPLPDLTLIPLEALPDVVPRWTIRLRWGEDPELAFTDEEAARIALMKMVRAAGMLP